MRGYKVFGRGKLLPLLRKTLEKTQKTLFVVGPWLDTYFTREIRLHTNDSVSARFLVRLDANDETVSEATKYALKNLFSYFPNFEARSLLGLHAKAVVLDNEIIFIGSTNWYRFSLEKAYEITLRTNLESVSGTKEILESYWKKGNEINLNELRGLSIVEKEIDYDLIDPLAREALRQNPKAYVKEIQK